MLALGCGSEAPKDTPDLDGLVHSSKAKPPEITIDSAQADAKGLALALARPAAEYGELLGAHKHVGSQTVRVKQGPSVLETLTTKVAITYDKDGRYVATSDNDREYGRHAIWDGKELFLRPRFGKYHRRAANDPSEPGKILSEMASGPHAYFDLLHTGIAVAKSSPKDIAKRAALSLELELGKGGAASETLAQRKWREDLVVTAVKGHVDLDRESVVPLAVELSGAVEYSRDGEKYTMEIELKHRIEAVGHAEEVQAPGPEQSVESPLRLTELDERETLLKGIAPPAKRGKALRAK